MTLPEEVPLFMQPDVTDDTYPGHVAVPVFDTELIAEDPAAPSRGYITRYSEIARLHACCCTNNEIAAALGYTAVRVSILLKDPFVQAEIAKWRTKIGGDALERMKAASVDGARRVHEIILDRSAKNSDVLAAATLAIDRAHGKPTQEHRHESGSLMEFIQLVREQRTPAVTGSPGTESLEREVIDVAQPANRYTERFRR